MLWWDENGVCFVLDQHTALDGYCPQFRRKQGKHLAELGHRYVFIALLMLACYNLHGYTVNTIFLIFELTEKQSRHLAELGHRYVFIAILMLFAFTRISSQYNFFLIFVLNRLRIDYTICCNWDVHANY